jgi:CO/xanthine dehydrogenase FAD-binding subunit
VSGYAAPSRLDHALEILATAPATILAGGTDFYPARVGRPLTEQVIDISGIGELRGISVTADVIRIGALTRWSEIRDAPLPRICDGLRLAAAEVGGRQVQNAGTIGGNLGNASPAADGVPPLLTLNAAVEVRSQQGVRVVPLAEFVTGYRRVDLHPGEMITAVLIPRGLDDAYSDFRKLGSRRYLVISIVMVAAVVAVDAGKEVVDARFAIGACSPVAQRLRALEGDLTGRRLAELAAIPHRGHLAVLSPIDDVRATADYRLEAALTLIRRVLAEVAP